MLKFEIVVALSFLLSFLHQDCSLRHPQHHCTAYNSVSVRVLITIVALVTPRALKTDLLFVVAATAQNHGGLPVVSCEREYHIL
jgi:hypothetical protein